MVHAAAGKGARRVSFRREAGRVYRRGLGFAAGRGACRAAYPHGWVRLRGSGTRRLCRRVRRTGKAARAARFAGGCHCGGDRCAEIRLFLCGRGKRNRSERADFARAAGARRGVRDVWAFHQAAGAEKPDAAAHSEAAVADGAAERHVRARGRAGTARQGAGARPKGADGRDRLARRGLNARGGCSRELSLRAGAGRRGRGAAGVGLHGLRL